MSHDFDISADDSRVLLKARLKGQIQMTQEFMRNYGRASRLIEGLQKKIVALHQIQMTQEFMRNHGRDARLIEGLQKENEEIEGLQKKIAALQKENEEIEGLQKKIEGLQKENAALQKENNVEFKDFEDNTFVLV